MILIIKILFSFFISPLTIKFASIILQSLNKGCIKTSSSSCKKALLEIVLNTINYKKCENDKRIILINNEYNILDFTISNKEKKKLINIGYKNAEDFFKKNN